MWAIFFIFSNLTFPEEAVQKFFYSFIFLNFSYYFFCIQTESIATKYRSCNV